MKPLLISLALCICTYTFGQSIEKFSIDSGGDFSSSGVLSILYTIGEVNINEVDNTFILSEGFINPSISESLGLTESEIYSFLIYPNPASKHLNIKYQKALKKVEIYNMLGKRVLLTNKYNKIDLSQLQSGIYLIKAFSEEKILTKKIIVK
ncbi:T9SS type A sorting domain-containing protein [uncultured Algibacter sp.]|uniref:T9SS type A sorting domain-containing protein n=1 Tax=uncultured Algibacter sp. TaxID=298659 RepID=UPI002635D914|nr:T9SS type A sorting domain-containing protein [uncultured Algibacter sp.]